MEKIAANGTERLLISNEQTNRLVHKWRSEEASILVVQILHCLMIRNLLQETGMVLRQ
mgnify:CR=1 FL=1